LNNKPTFLAVIPARGGSKRLPGKNILSLGNKPLIAHTIKAALSSKYISKTIVSSDDEGILNIAKKFGSDIIKRPAELATDTASSLDAIKHTIKNQKEKFDYIVLLQPTSPLRTSKHIDEAIELLYEKKALSIISVCELDHPLQWTLKVPEDLDITSSINNMDKSRSQDLDKHFRLNGAIYITETELLLKKDTTQSLEKVFAYIMDKRSSIDIDDEFDFKLAELYFKENK
jgi:CMP-N-acetylneuraminic acid synthetase